METEKYYEILGVTPSSGISEIRKAYRVQAKAFHPDINKSPGAHEKFILLREAYEYLTDLKSGRLTKSPEVVYTWTDERAEEARARAEKYAGMNFRDFKKSDYSKGSEALEIVADHLNLLLAFFLSAGILSVLTVATGPLGFLIGLGLSSVVIFISYKGVEGGVDLKRLVKAIWLIISHPMVIAIIFFAFNLVFVFLIGFRTLIPLSVLLWIYIGAIVLMLPVVLFMMKIRDGFKIRFYMLCIAPFIVNLFLIVNYVFSSSPNEETYLFGKGLQYVKDRYTRGYNQESTFINLEGGKYHEFEGIRIFLNFDELRRTNLVTYQFEDGLFGLRVMKSYKLRLLIYHGDGTTEILD